MDFRRIPRSRIAYSLTCLALLLAPCIYGADAQATRSSNEPKTDSAGADPGECSLCGGPEGLPCPEGESCIRQIGWCAEGFYGTCGRYSSFCLAVDIPFCGCDGEPVCMGLSTYSGPVAHHGACEDDCADMGDCDWPDSGAYCQFDSGCGAGPGVCRPIPAWCADDDAPVCGCDGRTYRNPCVAAQSRISIAYPGLCDDSCLDDPDKTEPGVCGCGIADLDSDGDGAPDCIDVCPADPARRVAGLLEPQFQVNQSWPCRPGRSAVALNPDARAVVVWEHGDGLSGRIFDGDGLGTGDEFRISDSGEDPAVGIDSAGSFVVAYVDTDGELEDEIFASLHDATGATPGQPFTVNTTHQGGQNQPSVAMGAEGNFVVVWRSYTPGNDVSRVFARLFDAAGVPLGDEILVAEEAAQWPYPAVAMDPTDNFVVTWNDTGPYIARARLFDSAGQPRSVEIQLVQDTSATVYSVAADAEGNFVVAGRASSPDYFARRFDRDGLPLGPRFFVNTTTTLHPGLPKLASDAAGNFVVVWTSVEAWIPRTIDERGQRFAADGTPLGGEFRVNAFAQGWQAGGATAANDAGRFVTVWSSHWPFDSRYGVFATRGIIHGDEDSDGTWDCHGPCETPPPDVCCAPANGLLTPIDDGDECTEDLCRPDGTVTRERIGPTAIGAELFLGKGGRAEAVLTWPALPDSSFWNVYRGTIQPDAPWAYDETCFAAELSSPSTSDRLVPPQGYAFTYLVGVVEGSCESPIGVDPDGAPRFADPGCAETSAAGTVRLESSPSRRERSLKAPANQLFGTGPTPGRGCGA